MRKIILLLFATTTLCSSYAWGPKGHDVVAYVAEQHLTRRAERAVSDILDGHSMVYVANWLDNASHTPDYTYTKTWHYCNVDPTEVSYKASEKSATGDVVTAINEIIDRLKSGELTRDEERIELMMLIHLVGDMHCPMHAGRKSDRGGNGTNIKFFGRATNLHSVWDSDIMEAGHRWSYTEWHREIDRISRKEQKAVMMGTPNEWIEQTVELARDIYHNTPSGTNISYDYIHHYTPLIESQLLRGGLRLAAILNDIY